MNLQMNLLKTTKKSNENGKIVNLKNFTIVRDPV